jgi:hypothetical protein
MRDIEAKRPSLLNHVILDVNDGEWQLGDERELSDEKEFSEQLPLAMESWRESQLSCDDTDMTPWTPRDWYDVADVDMEHPYAGGGSRKGDPSSTDGDGATTKVIMEPSAVKERVKHPKDVARRKRETGETQKTHSATRYKRKSRGGGKMKGFSHSTDGDGPSRSRGGGKQKKKEFTRKHQLMECTCHVNPPGHDHPGTTCPMRHRHLGLYGGARRLAQSKKQADRAEAKKLGITTQQLYEQRQLQKEAGLPPEPKKQHYRVCKAGMRGEPCFERTHYHQQCDFTCGWDWKITAGADTRSYIDEEDAKDFEDLEEVEIRNEHEAAVVEIEISSTDEPAIAPRPTHNNDTQIPEREEQSPCPFAPAPKPKPTHESFLKKCKEDFNAIAVRLERTDPGPEEAKHPVAGVIPRLEEDGTLSGVFTQWRKEHSPPAVEEDPLATPWHELMPAGPVNEVVFHSGTPESKYTEDGEASAGQYSATTVPPLKQDDSSWYKDVDFEVDADGGIQVVMADEQATRVTFTDEDELTDEDEDDEKIPLPNVSAPQPRGLQMEVIDLIREMKAAESREQTQGYKWGWDADTDSSSEDEAPLLAARPYDLLGWQEPPQPASDSEPDYESMEEDDPVLLPKRPGRGRRVLGFMSEVFDEFVNSTFVEPLVAMKKMVTRSPRQRAMDTRRAILQELEREQCTAESLALPEFVNVAYWLHQASIEHPEDHEASEIEETHRRLLDHATSWNATYAVGEDLQTVQVRPFRYRNINSYFDANPLPMFADGDEQVAIAREQLDVLRNPAGADSEAFKRLIIHPPTEVVRTYNPRFTEVDLFVRGETHHKWTSQRVWSNVVALLPGFNRDFTTADDTLQIQSRQAVVSGSAKSVVGQATGALFGESNWLSTRADGQFDLPSGYDWMSVAPNQVICMSLAQYLLIGNKVGQGLVLNGESKLVRTVEASLTICAQRYPFTPALQRFALQPGNRRYRNVYEDTITWVIQHRILKAVKALQHNGGQTTIRNFRLSTPQVG